MELIALSLLTVIASFIAGVSGFGFAVFLMSFFPIILGVKDANVLVFLAGIAITIYMFVPLRTKVKWWVVVRVLAGMRVIKVYCTESQKDEFLRLNPGAKYDSATTKSIELLPPQVKDRLFEFVIKMRSTDIAGEFLAIP